MTIFCQTISLNLREKILMTSYFLKIYNFIQLEPWSSMVLIIFMLNVNCQCNVHQLSTVKPSVALSDTTWSVFSVG